MGAVAWVALGGALGSVTRYLSVVAAGRLLGHAFPWGTLVVNVLGSLAIGFLAAFLMRRLPEAENMRLFLTTGFLGGFTTFSAFSLDAMGLLQRGETGAAAVYMVASVALSLLAVFAGYAASNMVTG